ncbi:MAG TPA: hypothetical protein VFS20_14040 [Longimicrobium sp.]|nr:hypothetical protein [Longimicrobium sp.]
MNPGDAGTALVVLLTLSLATERWVAMLTAAFPALAGEPRPGVVEVGRAAGRWRRLSVQGVAFAGAWIAAAWIAGRGVPTAAAFAGTLQAGGVAIPTPLAALGAVGGAAFWSRVVRCAGAASHIALTRSAAESLALRTRAERMGVAPAAGWPGPGEVPADRRTRLRLQLDADAPDRLDAPARRPG